MSPNVFVSVGNMDAPFSRLLEAVDREALVGELRGAKVTVQCGHTDFSSSRCDVSKFMGPAEFQAFVEQSDLLICHAGAGVLIQGLLARKPIVAVPRLSVLGEHLDDHQSELAGALACQGRIILVVDTRNIGEAIKAAREVSLASISLESTALSRAIEKSIDEFC